MAFLNLVIMHKRDLGGVKIALTKKDSNQIKIEIIVCLLVVVCLLWVVVNYVK